MSLVVSPQELCFPPPLDKVIACVLTLHNTESSIAAFKVKTTAPKRYCVRPNSGIVNPGEKVEVQILLQPMPPPEEVRSKDKFLVQSIKIRPEDATDLARVWASPAATTDMSEVKLKVFFQSPSERAASMGSETPRATDPERDGDRIVPAVTARGERPSGDLKPARSVTTTPVAPQQVAQPQPSAASASAGSMDITDLKRKLQAAAAELVQVTNDRDQLHDALTQATVKLEEVLATKKRLEEEVASSGARNTPRPPSPDHRELKKKGFSFITLLLFSILFALLGAAAGGRYLKDFF